MKKNCSAEEVAAFGSNCVPQAYELRPFNNRSGPFLARVIKSCHSLDVNSKCQRVEVPTIVFPDSPYRKTLRTGVCYGKCNGDLRLLVTKRTLYKCTVLPSGSDASCVPTNEANIIAHGPNGIRIYACMAMGLAHAWPWG